MPHHWWLIDPDNPGPKERAKAVRQAADEYGSEVSSSAGPEEHLVRARLRRRSRREEEAVYKAVGGRGKLFDLEGFEPEEKRRAAPGEPAPIHAR